MKFQCRLTGSDWTFLIDKSQYGYLIAQNLVYGYNSRSEGQKKQTSRLKILWNAFQAGGSTRQTDSIGNGYFATTFNVDILRDICKMDKASGWYDLVMGRLADHANLKGHIRLMYLNPDGNRLFVVSRMYEGNPTVKECQSVLCDALGWECVKKTCNINREYPFPSRESLLFEDRRIWTELDDENGVYLKSDSQAVETDGDVEFIGDRTNWVSFGCVTEQLDNASSPLTARRAKSGADGDSPQDPADGMTDEEIDAYISSMKRRDWLLSDESVPEVWPYPLNVVKDIVPYNFVRPMLVFAAGEVTTMLNGFRGVKNLKFRRDVGEKSVKKTVRRMVGNGLFMVVEGGSSRGKSNFSLLHDMLWSEHQREDKEAYEIENAYNDKASRRSQNKMLEERPQMRVNCLSPKISFAELIERIAQNGGRMMVCHSPEIHDLFTSLANEGSSKEVGAKFSSFLRMIYDQNEFSVDYKTYNSKRGFHKGCINYFICGTPGARSETFRDPEDGLVSRIWFVSLNAEKDGDEPVWDDMDEEEKKRFLEFQHWTMQERDRYEATGKYEEVAGSEFVYDILNKWEKDVESESVDSASDTEASFVRRSRDNVNAVGCILYLLFKHYHKDMSEEAVVDAVSKIVLWLAEQRLLESCMRYEVNSSNQLLPVRPKVKIFQLLPDEFYLSELSAMLTKYKRKTDPTQIASSWVSRGKLRMISTEDEIRNGIRRYAKIKN